MKRTTLSIFVFLSTYLFATDYYIDFDNGNDANSGTSQSQPWKHAPGDVNATANSSSIELQGGDKVIFKGGVHYRGNISLEFSGDSLNHIIYLGNSWGTEQAIIDGSSVITNWTAINDSIYYADVPDDFFIGETSASVNLHEQSSSSGQEMFMKTSQWPNPTDWFFYDEYLDFKFIPNQNITLNSITDSSVFNQDNPNYWNNSSLIVWTNPNMVIRKVITRFEPSTYTVYFDSLHAEAIYPDSRDQSYAIYNSIHAMDTPGEYYVNFAENRIYIYPHDINNIETGISASVRQFGINIANSSFITIEGFIIQKHSGDAINAGIGIGCYTQAYEEKSNIIIKDNIIKHNRHPQRGYGGIYLSGVSHALIDSNVVEDNFQHRGIFCTAGTDITVSNNTVTRSGSTSISFYNVQQSQINYNTVFESQGGHANGITMYIASKDILVAGNKLINCASPITFQDGGNFYFFNNLVKSRGDDAGVREWGRTNRGPWDDGEIVFAHNTFITASDQAGLSIERGLDTIISGNDTIFPNTYYSYNNIIDAGGGNHDTQRDYNIYTDLQWNQSERYDWYPAEHEIIEEDYTLIFTDTSNNNFDIDTNSLAYASAIDIGHLLPTDKFPDFDFNTDIDQNPRPSTQAWSIGAYEAYEIPITDPEDPSSTSQSHKTNITVAPNPTDGQISFSSDNGQIQKIEITDVIGNELLSEDNPSQNHRINLFDFTNGIYLAKVYCTDGVKTIKILVRH